MSGTNQKLLIIGLKLICVDQRSLYVLCNRKTFYSTASEFEHQPEFLGDNWDVLFALFPIN